MEKLGFTCLHCGKNIEFWPVDFTVIDKETGKEADTYNIALHEEWAKNLIYCDIDSFAFTEDGRLILMDDCHNVAYCPPGRFTVVWHYKQIIPIERRGEV